MAVVAEKLRILNPVKINLNELFVGKNSQEALKRFGVYVGFAVLGLTVQNYIVSAAAICGMILTAERWATSQNLEYRSRVYRG